MTTRQRVRMFSLVTCVTGALALTVPEPATAAEAAGMCTAVCAKTMGGWTLCGSSCSGTEQVCYYCAPK